MKEKGFSLIELILVVAILTILAGVSVPAYSGLQVRNDLEVSTNIVLQSLRRAQVLSQAVDGDSNWGVSLQVSDVTLFKGASYILRDTSYDEVYALSGNVTPSSLTEVVFSKLLGNPTTTGTVVLTSSNGQIQNISVGSKGQLDY